LIHPNDFTSIFSSNVRLLLIHIPAISPVSVRLSINLGLLPIK